MLFILFKYVSYFMNNNCEKQVFHAPLVHIPQFIILCGLKGRVLVTFRVRVQHLIYVYLKINVDFDLI